MGSTKTPGTEVCNGLDDDCDGKVDELDSMANKTSDDKLVYFAGKNVTMFAHEASRYDASGTDHGFDSTRRPCSVAGRQPWSNITKEEAQAACVKIGTGWRLCTATEWGDACNGASTSNAFPYGNTYNATRCNGYDYPKTAGHDDLGDRRGFDVCLRGVHDDERRRALRHEREREGVGRHRSHRDHDVLHDPALQVRDARRRLRHRQLHRQRNDDGARAAVRLDDARAGQRPRAPAVGRLPLLPSRKAAELSAAGGNGVLSHDD